MPSTSSHTVAMSLADPASWGVELHSADGLNGITQRWADTAKTDAEKALPVILFMHGFPESWFSWRHQLKAVGAAGFRGIAPDMRGYGGTSSPEHFANYSCQTLAADMMSLLQHIGASSAMLVGHDHGAATGWTLSLPSGPGLYLRPHRHRQRRGRAGRARGGGGRPGPYPRPHQHHPRRAALRHRRLGGRALRAARLRRRARGVGVRHQPPAHAPHHRRARRVVVPHR